MDSVDNCGVKIPSSGRVEPELNKVGEMWGQKPRKRGAQNAPTPKTESPQALAYIFAAAKCLLFLRLGPLGCCILSVSVAKATHARTNELNSGCGFPTLLLYSG